MATLRILFIFLLLVHGFIHLMGFVKSFGLAEMAQLTQPISRTTGFLWLSTSLLFAVTAALVLLQKEAWWMAAIPALILSQFLIFTNWQDARAGTFANLIILTATVIGFADWRFDRMVGQEVSDLLSTSPPPAGSVTERDLTSLPPVVQRWLIRSGVPGRAVPHFVHLKQKGEMRTSPGGDWVPFEAEQYFALDEPGFVWQTTIQASTKPFLSFLPIKGRDKYVNGRGAMLIKLLSLFAVADAHGPETDQATLLRFLGETSWFPSAALRNYIRWEPVSPLSARATMSYRGVTAAGLFRFTPDGDMAGFEARRYYSRPEGATPEDWIIRSTDWKEVDGFRIPCRSEVTWKLKDGDYTWLKLEITDIRFLTAPPVGQKQMSLSAVE